MFCIWTTTRSRSRTTNSPKFPGWKSHQGPKAVELTDSQLGSTGEIGHRAKNTYLCLSLFSLSRSLYPVVSRKKDKVKQIESLNKGMMKGITEKKKYPEKHQTSGLLPRTERGKKLSKKGNERVQLCVCFRLCVCV